MLSERAKLLRGSALNRAVTEHMERLRAKQAGWGRGQAPWPVMTIGEWHDRMTHLWPGAFMSRKEVEGIVQPGMDGNGH